MWSFRGLASTTTTAASSSPSSAAAAVLIVIVAVVFVAAADVGVRMPQRGRWTYDTVASLAGGGVESVVVMAATITSVPSATTASTATDANATTATNSTAAGPYTVRACIRTATRATILVSAWPACCIATASPSTTSLYTALLLLLGLPLLYAVGTITATVLLLLLLLFRLCLGQVIFNGLLLASIALQPNIVERSTGVVCVHGENYGRLWWLRLLCPVATPLLCVNHPLAFGEHRGLLLDRHDVTRSAACHRKSTAKELQTVPTYQVPSAAIIHRTNVWKGISRR